MFILLSGLLFVPVYTFAHLSLELCAFILSYLIHAFFRELDEQGGDDMFYIVENLVAFLGSEEIRAQSEVGKGKEN